MTNIPKLAPGETVCVSYRNKDGSTIAVMTHKPMTVKGFCLYILEYGKFVRFGKSDSPIELEENSGIMDRISSVDKS